MKAETINLIVPHSLQPGSRYLEPHFPPHRDDDWLVIAVDGQRLTVVKRTLRNLVADLSYGRLPQEWMERPVSNATMCPVCFMYARKLTDGSAVLRHRPACPGKD